MTTHKVLHTNLHLSKTGFLEEKLFLTFEADGTPLDVRVLDAMINRHFK